MKNAKLHAGDWVVICDGRKAMILVNAGDEKFPNLRTKETYEQHDSPTHAQGADAPGRVHSSTGTHRSAVEQTDWHDQEERKFLGALADRLDNALRKGETSAFIMVAAPRALGMIRHCYSPAVRHAIRAEVGKEYIHMPLHEIENKLAELDTEALHGNAEF